MRFAFIETEKASFPVALMCRVLKVSRAGFYAWRSRPAATRTRQDHALAAEVAAIYTSNRGCYGSPRVQVELRERGHRVGRKRVARLMRQQGSALVTSAATGAPPIHGITFRSRPTCWRGALR